MHIKFIEKKTRYKVAAGLQVNLGYEYRMFYVKAENLSIRVKFDISVQFLGVRIAGVLEVP